MDKKKFNLGTRVKLDLYCRVCNVSIDTAQDGKVSCPKCGKTRDFEKAKLEAARYFSTEQVKKMLGSKNPRNPKPEFILK